MNGSIRIMAAKDGEDLGNEDQRLFLDLRERLQERDDEADHQGDEHERRSHLEERHDAVAGDVEDGGAGHGGAVRSACA